MPVQSRPRHVDPVALSALARTAGTEAGDPDVEVTGISLRSTSVRPGDLYAALPGARTHGARFAAAAKAAGAVAILTDEEGAVLTQDVALPTLVVDTPRALLGEVAAAVYGSPAGALTLVGRHRDPGQDDDHPAARLCTGRGRSPYRGHRDDGHLGRRRAGGICADDA